MKVLFITSFFTFLFKTILFAQIVTLPGTATRGATIVYLPKQGESFRVSQDLSHIVSGANYDVQMRNGKNIYFENKHQEDDIYFVFNDAIESGDQVIVKVNKGRFHYAMESMNALPKPVQSVLRASGKSSKKKHYKKETKKSAVIETENYCFDENGNAYSCEEPKVVSKSLPVQKTKLVEEKPVIAQNNVPRESSVLKQPKKEKPNFLKLFSEKIERVFLSIKKNLKEQQTKNLEKTIAHTKTGNASNATASKEENKPIENITKNAAPQKLPGNNLKSQSLPVEAFRTDIQKQQRKIAKPQFSKAIAQKIPQDMKVDYLHDRLPAYQVEVPQKLERLSSYDNLPSVSSQPLSNKPVIVQKSISPQDVDKIEKSKISLPKIAHKMTMQKEKLQAPAYTQPQPLKYAPVQENVIPQSPIDSETQSAPEFETMHHMPSTMITTPTIPEPVSKAPVQPVQNVITEKAPAVEKKGKKIVITKIIAQKNKQTTPAPVLERMSDRVMGNGYSDTHGMGNVRVRAYSNSKPISAWVEVYQNDNIHRVKSFYTGSTKKVELPAGTYILKATYRSGSSKQKKNLGRITLQEGESIHKKIYFNIGTLNIVAKKKDKPLYVKVEVYKKNAKRKYAYTFSSRNTGVAHLKLGQGRYKIIVKEHAKTKVFDNVYVKGGKLKTLRADF